MCDVQNIYGLDGQQQSDTRYLKKTGDTATGEIIFDAGIQVNNGLTEINGPAEFNDEVLFNVGSTVIVNGAVEITGPSLLVTSNLTEFNGTTTEFNGDFITIGSSTAPNNTPVFTTYRSQVNLGDGGQGSVNVETAVNLGGFASLNLLNADINMEDDSIINQTGTRTIPNNMYSMNMIAGSQITFPDTTIQNSAYTGAGALAGTYGPVQMTVDANGKITALSNAVTPSPTDISVNTITQPISYNPSAPVGWTLLQTGSNACCSISNAAGVYPTGFSSAMVSDYVANKGVLISLSPSVNLLQVPSIKLRITFSFFGPPQSFGPYQNYGNWGQTTCDMDMFPACWTQANFNVGSGTPVGLGAFYNINNKIGGISSFVTFPFVIGTTAPNGRQYWTYNQSFSGTSGPNGYLCPISSHQWVLLFSIPGSTYSWSGKVEMLDATEVIALGGTVGLSSYAVVV